MDMSNFKESKSHRQSVGTCFFCLFLSSQRKFIGLIMVTFSLLSNLITWHPSRNSIIMEGVTLVYVSCCLIKWADY
ncbi:hypothetical protein D3C73_1185090 [compost metagenome]